MEVVVVVVYIFGPRTDGPWRPRLPPLASAASPSEACGDHGGEEAHSRGGEGALYDEESGLGEQVAARGDQRCKGDEPGHRSPMNVAHGLHGRGEPHQQAPCRKRPRKKKNKNIETNKKI